MGALTTIHCFARDSRIRAELARASYEQGFHGEVYGSFRELADHHPESGIIVARDWLEDGGIPRIFEQLSEEGIWLPVVAVDVHPSMTRVVSAIRAGALDYLSLPLDQQRFGIALREVAREAAELSDKRRVLWEARRKIAMLSSREREVLDWLAEGASNKMMARSLAISPRTVEIHRANMMNKLEARHAAHAVRIRFEAQLDDELVH